MADAYTTTASVNSVQTAYEIASYFALRPELFHDRMADVKPTKQSMPGNPVTFTFWAEMAAATTALNQSTDVDAVALSDSQTTVTLVEQGNAVLTTAKLRGTSFLNVDMDAANLVGFNAGLSLDTLARTPLLAGTNVLYPGTTASRATLTPATVMTAAVIRKTWARLHAANVQPWMDGFYRAIIHSDVAYDIKSETGNANWRDPHVYSEPGDIWRGSIGEFEGFEFLVSPRASVLADAGSSPATTDVYQSIFMGKQALAKAYSSSVSAPLPQIVLGEITDKLKRQKPIGWYWLGGYNRFREAALYRVEAASAIGTN